MLKIPLDIKASYQSRSKVTQSQDILLISLAITIQQKEGIPI